MRLPYFALGPGSVRDTAGLIDSDGETFDPGEVGVAFPTVSVSGRVTVWQLLAGWLDPEVDIVREELILQGRTPEQSQQFNLQQMDDAKDVAIKVALSELGQAEGFGAEVVEVVAESPAAEVLAPGDVIVAVNGADIRSSTALVEAIVALEPGTTVDLGVVRGADRSSPDPPTENVTAVLTDNPDRPGAAFFGVRVQTYFVVTYPHDIAIDSGQVGGPSAGLAFALGVLDLLTPGDLTGGQEVVATGTIQPNGAVGPIGGLKHKVDAARNSGADIFLVPGSQRADELEEAERRARGDVEIVPVSSLDEALAALAERGGRVPGDLVLEPQG